MCSAVHVPQEPSKQHSADSSSAMRTPAHPVPVLTQDRREQNMQSTVSGRSSSLRNLPCSGRPRRIGRACGVLRALHRFYRQVQISLTLCSTRRACQKTGKPMASLRSRAVPVLSGSRCFNVFARHFFECAVLAQLCNDTVNDFQEVGVVLRYCDCVLLVS